jgi:hypothetical protein
MQMFLLKGLARRAFQNDRLPPRHYGSGSPAPPRTWRLWWRLWYQGLRDRASAVTSGTLFLVSNRSPCDAHRGIAARSPRPAGRCSQCRREIMRPVNGSSMIRPRTQAAPKLPAASFPTAPAMKAYYSIGFLLRRSIESREDPVMARGGSRANVSFRTDKQTLLKAGNFKV